MVISPQLAFIQRPACAINDIQSFCFWFQLFAYLPIIITYIKLVFLSDNHRK